MGQLSLGGACMGGVLNRSEVRDVSDDADGGVMRSLLRMAWRWARSGLRLASVVRGRRTIRAMGFRMQLHPRTEFPSTWRFPLPRDGPKSRIVRFADFVQMHAICRCCEDMNGTPWMVDCGAHHGVYAVVMGLHAKRRGGRVLAIEPNPEAFAMLCDNVRWNGLEGTVVCEQVAVTERTARVVLSMSGSQSALVATSGGMGAEGVEVQGVPLAELLRKHGFPRVDLLVLDVEGAEIAALRSYPWETTPLGHAFVELHPYAWDAAGLCGEDLACLLRARRLRCLDMYFEEHTSFPGPDYLGPCVLLPENGPP